MVSIAAVVRLSPIFLRFYRARPIKNVDVWSLALGSIIFGCDICTCIGRAELVIKYFAAILMMRFMISLFVHWENAPIRALASMQKLNDELSLTLERLKTDRLRADSIEALRYESRRLRALDWNYNARMQTLADRVDHVNSQLRLRLHDLETQREDLQQELFNLQEEIDRLLRSERRSAVDGDRDIGGRIDEALERAEVELDIASCWLSFKVMRALKSRLKNLLERGVTIKILYGTDDDDDARDVITRKAAKMLRREFKRYENFRLMRGEVRERLIICDEKFYVVTAYNVLSFDGELDGEYSTEKDSLRRYREQYFEGETL